MKKIKLLFSLALIFATLSFSFKAKAQTMVPVVLTSLSNYYPSFAAGATWYVSMRNNSTNDIYNFQTYSYNLHDGHYSMGSVPPGTYTVTVSYSHNSIYELYFDWSVDDIYGYSKYMHSDTDYELTGSAVVPDDYTYEYNIVLSMS